MTLESILARTRMTLRVLYTKITRCSQHNVLKSVPGSTLLSVGKARMILLCDNLGKWQVKLFDTGLLRSYAKYLQI